MVLRYVFESLILYTLTVSVINEEKYLQCIIKLYLLCFVFYGLLGIVGGGRVAFHISLKNEDAFGPFMAMGVPMAFFAAYQAGVINYKLIAVCVLNISCVVASFAKGAFLSLSTGIFYIWYRYQSKFIGLIIVVLGISVVMAAASIMFKHAYWEEMATILEANKEEVGVGDTGRQFLWKNGWRMYLDHPILGVGPRNYGFVLPRTTTSTELDRYGYASSYIYGRVPHNIYIQLISEMGMVGAISFFILIFTFFKRNRQVRLKYNIYRKHNNQKNRKCSRELSDSMKRYNYLAIGLEGSLIVYLVNGLFYDLLYMHWFSDILILNSLVFKISSNSAINE